MAVGMIRITGSIALDERDISESFVRASGPGGQNVNKVSTAVQLRFVTNGLTTLPEDVRERLKRLAGKRMTLDGEILLTAQRFRTQERNREDALARLVELVKAATERPKPRRPTKPTYGSKLRRLESKSKRSDIKGLRQSRPSGE
jgi:ribosome-associated protein